MAILRSAGWKLGTTARLPRWRSMCAYDRTHAIVSRRRLMRNVTGCAAQASMLPATSTGQQPHQNGQHCRNVPRSSSQQPVAAATSRSASCSASAYQERGVRQANQAGGPVSTLLPAGAAAASRTLSCGVLWGSGSCVAPNQGRACSAVGCGLQQHWVKANPAWAPR